MPDPEVIAEIVPGRDTREDVIAQLGTPSAISSFQDNTWYYVGKRQEQVAFFSPDLIDQQVFEVSFDENGRVLSTRLYTKADQQAIDPVDRITPTEGKELTLMQQLLGNLGRFPIPEGP